MSGMKREESGEKEGERSSAWRNELVDFNRVDRVGNTAAVGTNKSME